MIIDTFTITKYVQLCNFKNSKKSRGGWNFKCDVCKEGNSWNKSGTRRGYVLNNSGHYNYYCHNCGISMSFIKFLRIYKPTLYEEYKKELYGLNTIAKKRPEVSASLGNVERVKRTIQTIKSKDILKDLISLNDDAIAFCHNRKLPKAFIKELYYSDNYIKFLKSHDLYENDYLPEVDRRIVIPYYNKEKVLTYIQGRSIDENKMRYVTTKLNEDCPKIWGLDRIDNNKKIRITEGVLDAIFIDNCLAVGGGTSSFDVLYEQVAADNIIMCFDRDVSHNSGLKRILEKNIGKGVGVFFWDGGKVTIKEKSIKDFNDMILCGYSVADIDDIIKQNTYYGLEASVKLKMLRRKY